MMLEFVRNVWFVFLFIQSYFPSLIEAELQQFAFTIRDENGVETQLKWTQASQNLANEHLPLFGVDLDQSISRNEDIMNEIGDFETYYDLDKSSAVIFLKKSNRFFGVIGTKYVIVGLPTRKMSQVHIIGKSRHVILNPNRSYNPAQSFDVPSNFQDDTRLTADKRPFVEPTFDPSVPSTSYDSQHLPPKKRPRPDEPEDDSTIHGSILRKFLSTPVKTLFNMNSREGSVANPDVPKKPSDANKLLKLLLKSPCVLPPSPKKPHLGTFYPEILLLVSYDALKLFENIGSIHGFTKDHVLYLIIYMNAISMLFAKLKNDVDVHINIAGIVFETEEGAFPFSSGKFINDQLVAPTGDLVLNTIVKYINDRRKGSEIYRQMFTEDAFDFFLYMTTFGGDTQEINEENNRDRYYHGIATEPFDVMEQRVRLRYLGLNINILGAAVETSNILLSYVDGAREIAHLMGTNGDYSQSDTIMGSKSFALRHSWLDCLKWSEQSVNSFRDHFSNNKNRCYLLNKPRSLHAFGVPQRTLSPTLQCDCYSFYARFEERFSLDARRAGQACMAPLPCINPTSSASTSSEQLSVRQYLTVVTVPLPVDGTPCGNGKVCWQRQCVSTPSSLTMPRGIRIT